MGSSTATAPETSPATSYYVRDCSQGICTTFCPQLCNNYDLFGPPPPLYTSDSSKVSPLMIALISVLAAAFLLLSYYTFASRCCKRRRTLDEDDDLHLQTRLDLHGAASVQSNGGLGETFISSITVFKYKRGDGIVESTDCAVCLTEFKEEERLRLMPNCQHAFHPPCIDTWLRSHSNCPICRASMIGPPPPVVSQMRVQRGGDVVVMVVDGGVRDRVREIGSDGRELNPRRQEGEVLDHKQSN